MELDLQKICNKHLILAKTVSWNIIATTKLLLIAYVVTGQWMASTTVAMIDFATRCVMYYLHETYWDKKTLNKDVICRKRKSLTKKKFK